MSIVVRDVREHELDSVLALNNAAGPAILPLDAARLRYLFENAEYFRVAERDGTLWAADARGGVTRIAADGKERGLMTEVSRGRFSHFSDAEIACQAPTLIPCSTTR